MVTTAAVATGTRTPGLVFDEAGHTYHLDGARLLSVTQQLTLSGHIDPRWYTEYGRQRGIYAHQTIALCLAGNLDESSLSPVLVPYLDAFRRWLDTSRFVPALSEARYGDRLHRVAGTIDCFGLMGNDAVPTIVDFKTGEPEPYHRLQLAAYADLFHEADALWPVGLHTLQRLGLYLRSDGTFTQEDYTRDAYAATVDLHAWLAARINAQWRWAHDPRARRLLESEDVDGRST